MKKFLFTGVFLGISGLLYSQGKLEQVGLPSNPATSILGIQPNTTLTPKSIGAFEVALFNNFVSENQVLIPNDFSMEFSPYWFKKHGLTPKQIFMPENPLSHLLYNFSVSIGSTKNYILGDSSKTDAMALGIRTSLFFGSRFDRDTLTDLLTTGQNHLTALTNSANLVSETMQKNNISKEVFFITIREGLIAIFIESRVTETRKEASNLFDKLQARAKELPSIDSTLSFKRTFQKILGEELNIQARHKMMTQYLTNREGLRIDFAFARLINFPTNDFEYSLSPKYSFWVAPRLHLRKMGPLSINGVYRYESYDSDYFKRYFPSTKVFQQNHDFGGALEVKFSKVIINLEMVGRSQYSEIPAGTDSNGDELYKKEKNTDFQYILSLQYAVSKQLTLNYSIGNRFQPIQNPNSTLVSQIGLNLGLGMLE